MTNSNAEGSAGSSVTASSVAATSPSQCVAGADGALSSAPTVAAIVAASRPNAKHDDKSKAASPANGKFSCVLESLWAYARVVEYQDLNV